jgi:hypothetical protein
MSPFIGLSVCALLLTPPEHATAPTPPCPIVFSTPQTARLGYWRISRANAPSHRRQPTPIKVPIKYQSQLGHLIHQTYPLISIRTENVSPASLCKRFRLPAALSSPTPLSSRPQLVRPASVGLGGGEAYMPRSSGRPMQPCFAPACFEIVEAGRRCHFPPPSRERITALLLAQTRAPF